MIIDIVKVIFPATISFLVGIAVTPFLAKYLYANRMWKKRAGKVGLDGEATPLFNKLHEAGETGTPKMGGIVIWFSAIVTTLGFWMVARFFPGDPVSKLDFLTRNQTWIPLFTLLLGALIGLLDDLLDIHGTGDHVSGGLSLKKRLLAVALIGGLAGFWFYWKLDVVSIGLPFINSLYIGWLLIPLFSLTMLAIYSGGIIDGIDGLAGGIFAIMFGAYGVIAFYQTQINLAAFCAAMLGGILAFLWFNIPPARFYMSETGSMALTITLTVIAFMTDSLGDGHGLIALLFIALPLLLTSLSAIVQMLSKKYRRRKVFEAIGWPSYKVTMRYWIFGVICALFGIILALVG